MGSRLVTIVPVIAVIGAGAYALWRPASTSPAGATEASLQVPAKSPQGTTDPQAATLPPDHPPIGGVGSPHGQMEANEPPAIRWQVPSGWQVAPNPNAMRIATYRVPAASHGTDDAEMSVARAGGSTQANIQRWLGQFDEAGPDKQTEMTVRGLKVTVVEVSGTYLGGGMIPGAAPARHPKWTLLAAIVDTAGSSYFFKLVGPEATVRAERAAFDGLVNSCTPS